MSELFRRSLMGWIVFLLLLAVGQAVVPFKTIYKSIKPFGLTTTDTFDEATFKKNGVEFDTFSKYEAIEIGGDKVSASKDEKFRKEFHVALSEFFNAGTAEFIVALKKAKKTDFENMEKVVKSSGTAADKYNAVYTKFFMKKDVIDAIVALFNSKIYFSLKGMKEWKNSAIIDTMVGIDILGINEMRKALGNKELAKEEVKKAILESKRKSFVNLIVSMMKIPTASKAEWYNAFFNLFNGMKDNEFLDDCMFSDKFDDLTTKKSVTGTEYIDVILLIMTTKLEKVTTVKKVADLKALDGKVKDVNILTKFRMRNLLIANKRYFGIDVTFGLLLKAFNFKSSTWASFADIQKSLNEIVLLTAATQIERFNAVLERSKSRFEGFNATSADELRKAFFNKAGLVFGYDNVFIKMKNESIKTIFDTAEDLSVGECISLKKFFKESDFFGFLAQYAFYKNPTFDLPTAAGLFTDQQQSKAYREVNFSKLIVAFGTLKIKSINDLTKQLAPLVASNKKFPDLGFLESLRYSLGDMKKKDASVVLTDIYNFTVDYFVTNASSVATLKVKNYSSKLELFLFFASPFKTANNIFKRQLTVKQIQDEQFNSFDAVIATQSLNRINANLDEAKRIFMTFITCDVFLDYYNSLIAEKKISKLSSFTVLSFINYVGDIVTAIVSFGSDDVMTLASGSSPAYFDAFIVANFFAIPITDAASLKKNICFMIEMRNMLNDIDVLKGIDTRVQLWSSLSLITDPKSVYMQQAERKAVVAVLKVTASNDEYMAVLKGAFKLFIPILNQSLKTEKISNEKGLKDFFEKNGKEFFAPWIDSLVTLKLFGISPTKDTLDCKIAIKKYEAESSQKLSKKITEVATSLELSENEILSFLPRLTQETSRVWYDQMVAFPKPGNYSAAITLFLDNFEALLDYLVEKAGEKKDAAAKSEIELIFKSRPINADVLFSKNFLKLKDYSTEEGISDNIVKSTLGFVVEDIENAFSEADVLINNAEMLAASSDDKFFEDSTNEELRTAWNEFKSEKTLVLRIRKLATVDDKSLVKLFIAAWKASLIKPAEVTEGSIADISFKSGTGSIKPVDEEIGDASFVEIGDVKGKHDDKLKSATKIVVDTAMKIESDKKKDESDDKVKLAFKSGSVSDSHESVEIVSSKSKDVTVDKRSDSKTPAETSVIIDPVIKTDEKDVDKSKETKPPTEVIIDVDATKKVEDGIEIKADSEKNDAEDKKVKSSTEIIADVDSKETTKKTVDGKTDTVSGEKGKETKISTEPEISSKKDAEIKKDSIKKDDEKIAEKITDATEKVSAEVKKTEIHFDDSANPKKVSATAEEPLKTTTPPNPVHPTKKTNGSQFKQTKPLKTKRTQKKTRSTRFILIITAVVACISVLIAGVYAFTWKRQHSLNAPVGA